jgi:hypothetical protein
MPRPILNYVYKFDELSESAKQKAIDDYRQDGFDYDWWDAVYEDARQIGEIIGIKIDNIYFSGFSSQGDGACFEGKYTYTKGSVKKIKDHAPQDEELHRIARELQKLQKKNFYSLSAKVKQSGHYSHEYCTEIEVCDNLNSYGDVTVETEKALSELLRDFMRWIYKSLETDWDYLSSDEQIVETIQANEWEFDENGDMV